MKPCDHSFTFEHFRARCITIPGVEPGWAIDSRCVKCGAFKTEAATAQRRIETLEGLMEEFSLVLALTKPDAEEPPA